MTAVAPSREAGEQVNQTVTIGGKVLDTDRLVSVETWSEANRIPRARIVLFDGEPDTQKFPLSESAPFAPGSKVAIAAGYGSSSKALHSGVVVRHAIRIGRGVAAQLVIETADPLLKMTLRRNSAVNQNKSDKDVIAALLSANGGSAGTNHASAAPIEALVQYHASDWDLLLLRAEASGCLVLVEDGKAQIVSPTAAGSSTVILEYGDSIVSLEAVIDAAAALPSSAVTSRSWSYNQQKRSEGSAGSADVTAPGNLDAETLAKVFGVDSAVRQTGAYVPDGRLADWSTADLMRSRLGAIQGEIRFQGTAAVKPGDFVSLAGLGARFNGDAFARAVRHVIRDGMWQTIVCIGMTAESFASARSDIAAPPAGGLLPPIRGLHTGQVKQVAADPSGDYRVLVTLPLVDDANGVWARIPQFYASSGFGAVFYPEVGDEVVLGFMDQDPGNPIILGSLYSSQRAPDAPTQPDEENNTKAIVTRNGKLRIVFDDKDTILTILTGKGRTLVLDDKAESIEVSDKFNNKIVMTKESVDILGGSDLNITSKKAMTINAGTSLAVGVKAGYTLVAATVEEKSKGTLSISSTGPGEFKSTAPLTIKGALVNIN